MSRPSAALAAAVQRRAGGVCEYCHFPEEHFGWRGVLLEARSEIRSVTFDVLRMNQPNAVAVRQILLDEGLWNPGSVA